MAEDCQERHRVMLLVLYAHFEIIGLHALLLYIGDIVRVRQICVITHRTCR